MGAPDRRSKGIQFKALLNNFDRKFEVQKFKFPNGEVKH